jgi:hypothetical protein
MAFLSKTPRGTTLAEDRASRRRDREAFERTEKQKVRKRDKGRCRWPRCEFRKDGLLVEVAHVKAKGMGGDRGKRSTANQMLCICKPHHQAPYPSRSMHSGDLTILVLDKALGTDGPCAFYDGLELVATETAPGVLEKTR